MYLTEGSMLTDPASDCPEYVESTRTDLQLYGILFSIESSHASPAAALNDVGHAINARYSPLWAASQATES